MNTKEAALRAGWTPGCAHDRSVLGFRIRHGGPNGPMSKAKYHDLKNKGLGPREIRNPGMILITAKDEEAWDRERAEPKKSAEKRLLEREAEARRQRGKHAASKRKVALAKAKREGRHV